LNLPTTINFHHFMANLIMNNHPSIPLLAGLLSLVFAGLVCTPLASAEENNAPIGWASVSGRGVETTTGGANGDVVTARTAKELAEYASHTEPLTILIEGAITGDGVVKIASDKTLLGLGESTSLKNIELNMSGVSNVIIRNLHISHARDAIALRRTHHVWVDHCDLSECGDGLLDINHQSDFVTVSWTRFSKHHKTMLINSGTSQPEDSGYLNTTIHHCWFDGSDTRNPRVGYGKVHVFNCLYSRNDYGIGLHSQCLVLAERNHFDQVKNPIKQMYRPDPTDIHHGFCESVENVFQDCRGTQDDEGKSFSAKEFYEYDSAMDEVDHVPEIVRMNVGPKKHIGKASVQGQ
jgi:pectate lyase